MKQRTAGRLAWSLVALFIVVGSVSQLAQVRLVGWSGSFDDLLFLPAFAAFSVVGALVASRQPRNAVGWIFLGVATMAITAFGSSTLARVAVREGGPGDWVTWVAWVSTWAWVVFFTPMVIFLPLLFPDGRLPSRRWRPYAWFCGVLMTAIVVAFALDPGPLPGFGYAGLVNPVGVGVFDGIGDLLDGGGFVLPILLGGISAVSLVIRFRRSGRAVRDQIKWFVFAFAVLAGWLLVTGGLTPLGVQLPQLLDSIISALIFAGLPVAAGIGILKYRLFDIDVVINRALMYAVLAAIVTGVYVGVVVGIGALVGSRGNLFLSVVATALIAIAFQPLRERVRHFANRLVYGKRATPYEVLSRASEHLGAGFALEEVLPELARLTAEATGAERSGIWLHRSDGWQEVARWPGTESRPRREAGETLTLDGERAFPVRHRGETLGAITVAMPRREDLTPTHEQLLEDLAAQAGLVLRNVSLLEELRASRQRIVAAQDEERRRIERDIHDGAQQQLVALAVRLKLAEAVAKKTAPDVAEMLDGIREDTTQALENLRDLARGIYPPLLADQGLAAALTAQARKVPLSVQVEPNGIARYPQEVEAAVYFCVLESLQNTAKYAEASRAVVRLRSENADLLFEIEDDGRGFDVRGTAQGAGLTNMRDRVEALGGSLEITSGSGRGTRVTGRVPAIPERGS